MTSYSKIHTTPEPQIILVDMDGVIADQHLGFLNILERRYPEIMALYGGTDVHYDFELHFPEEHREFVRSLREEAGFFRDLPLVKGAKESVLEMLDLGHQVTICTAPIWKYTFCVPEKLAWIEQYFGHDLAAQTIITRDKTLIRGDFLIDDKPEVSGRLSPQWEHVVFDRPYNNHVTNKRRINWENWREVLDGQT